MSPITLDVGGTHFKTSRSTLTAHPDSFFAKLLDGEHSQTATGHMIGTPSYFAPEYAEGMKSTWVPLITVVIAGSQPRR